MLFNVGIAVKLYVTSTNITSLLVHKKTNSKTRFNHIKRSAFSHYKGIPWLPRLHFQEQTHNLK
jgi:hypothetical protein